MLKYLIVQLDDTAVSFCHYTNSKNEQRLIPLDTLKEALFWSMKENLNVQFVYPDYELPAEYKAVIDTVDHADIVSADCQDKELKANADVVVFNSPAELNEHRFSDKQAGILRLSVFDFNKHIGLISEVMKSVTRLNIVFTDVENFDKTTQTDYAKSLDTLAEAICNEYKNVHPVQCNLLTDRILLDKMNNCNAGDEHLTIAPDGNFYVCPAFYFEGNNGYSAGDIKSGPDIKNPQLYKLAYAPICRQCDAYQCKRCVWLNRRMTLEVNTPSHEQCVMAHIERNASRNLLSKIREIGEFMPETEISEINYLDPIVKITKQ